MFDRDILKPNKLSSKIEDRELLYFGWEILAYTGKANQEQLKQEIRNHFNGEGWTSCEYDHRLFVQHDSFDSEVEIVFGEQAYPSESAKNAEKYKITFKSSYFGSKTTSEKYHRKLYNKVFPRIRWKKRGFWIKENKRFPIPKTIRLKLKRG